MFGIELLHSAATMSITSLVSRVCSIFISPQTLWTDCPIPKKSRLGARYRKSASAYV